MKKNTEKFYDEISSKYTEAILKCVPRYSEMIEMLFYYLNSNLKPKTILELGCGTGNLTGKIVKKFRNSEITAVDLSSEIIEECRMRVDTKNINFIKSDFSKLNLQNEKFDLVISSIAIHHLQNKEKKMLFKNIYKCLKPNGYFTFSDQFKGESETLYQLHMDLWKTKAFENNISENDWETWMEHQKSHDYHETIENQIQWIKEAGFKNVDIVWKYALWTVIQGKKE